MKTSYIALDLETTGLDPQKDQILEIGAVKIQDGKEIERYETFVRVGISIPEKIQELTGITEEMAASGIPMEEAVRGLLDFCGKEDILGHNILFDYSFVKCHAARIGENFEKNGMDTLKIARKFLPELKSRSLESLCSYFGIAQEKKHRASWDALAASRIYQILGERFEGQEPDVFLAKPLVYRVKKESPIII